MHIRRMVVSVVALCALFVSVWMLPDAAASEGAREPARPLAEMTLSASRIDWLPVDASEPLVLTVAGPAGIWVRKEFAAGQPASLSLSDPEWEHLPDGTYTWELRVGSPPGKLPQKPLVESGHFFVKDGSFVPVRKKASATPQRKPRLITAESHINDHLSVTGNVCVGLSCTSTDPDPNLPSLIVKAQQPHIRFDDQFVEGGGTPHDWALLINPTSAAEFSIADAENGLLPFAIAGGAPNSSVYVAGNGDLGLGTSTPGEDIHAVSGDTPTLRLEQDGSGGFSGRTWDVGANHTELFVKDVTNSSSVPFRIKAGTPSDSLVVNNSGSVGIGTSSPATKLHLFDNAANVFTILTVQNTGSGVNSQGVVRVHSDTTFVSLQAHGSGRTLSRFGQTLASWSELIQSTGNGLIIGTGFDKPLILGTNSTNRLQIDGNTGAVTVSGNLTVTGTKNFAVADPADARRAIYYTALEGPEAGTYFRGTARTIKGEAVIELPDYFARLTEPERLTVQLTPVGSWGQLYVAEKTPSRLIVRLAPGSTDLEFDYLVQGVRKGYLDYQVQRPNTLPK